MKLIPLVNQPREGLIPSKLEPTKEISQDEFLKNYAENPLSVAVDGKSDITAYSEKQPMGRWFLVE